MRRGIPFVVSGPSGAGKGTLCARVMAELSGLTFSVSCTTREPRKGETDGVEYFFIQPDEFAWLVADGGFLEHASVHDKRYGTPRRYVEEKRAEGTDVLLDVDVQGAMQIKKTCPDAVYVFVAPPSYAVLRDRLRGRGTESEDKIATRLKNARAEALFADKYDYFIVNDDLDVAVEDFKAVVRAERRRVSRDAETVASIIKSFQEDA